MEIVKSLRVFIFKNRLLSKSTFFVRFPLGNWTKNRFEKITKIKFFMQLNYFQNLTSIPVLAFKNNRTIVFHKNFSNTQLLDSYKFNFGKIRCSNNSGIQQLVFLPKWCSLIYLQDVTFSVQVYFLII